MFLPVFASVCAVLVLEFVLAGVFFVPGFAMFAITIDSAHTTVRIQILSPDCKYYLVHCGKVSVIESAKGFEYFESS